MPMRARAPITTRGPISTSAAISASPAMTARGCRDPPPVEDRGKPCRRARKIKLGPAGVDRGEADRHRSGRSQQTTHPQTVGQSIGLASRFEEHQRGLIRSVPTGHPFEYRLPSPWKERPKKPASSATVRRIINGPQDFRRGRRRPRQIPGSPCSRSRSLPRGAAGCADSFPGPRPSLSRRSRAGPWYCANPAA